MVKPNDPMLVPRTITGRIAALLLIISILYSNGAKAQQPWQRLTDPAAKEVAAEFVNPPTAYANTVTWGWDGPMSREVIRKDLDSLYRLGFRAVTIEAGYHMPVAYLSDGWFQLIKEAVAAAKARNMRVWIIDEGKYPSGFAGGLFSRERPDLRMQALVSKRITLTAGQSFSMKVTSPVFSAVAFNKNDSSCKTVDVHSGELSFTADGADWELLLVQPQFKTSVTRSVNNPAGGKDTTNALCDYLSAAAVRQFLNFTHEQYKKYIGDEFGKTVLGFRGDEPDFAFIPWTPSMLQEFKQRKGYDVQPYLATFFLPKLSDEQKRIKADYWDVWSDLFGQHFFQQQADWCAANNLEYMVHLNHDDAMVGLVRSEGDFYKDFRSVQIPGIDVIWHQMWPGMVADFPKYASSAAHLFGRPRALSESFAAFNPAPNLQQARVIVNQQLVRGINLFEFMFFASTSGGRGGARGYMADTAFHTMMAYANRAAYLLAQGKPAAQIAVYFPTTSLWLGYNNAEQSTMGLAKALGTAQLDFDFIDDYSIINGTLRQGSLVNKSGQLYRVVLIPSVITLSNEVLKKLQAFAKGGGKVIFTGNQPALSVGKSFLKATPAPAMPWAQQMKEDAVPADLPWDVNFNRPAPAVRYLHRTWKDAELFFFFNEGDQPFNQQVTLQANGEVQEWDLQNGSIKTYNQVQHQKATSSIDLQLAPYEGKLLVVVKK
jgi:hypothetical protein